MALKIINDIKQIDYREWENFVNSHPDGNVFQMPWMYDVYLHTNRHKPVAIFAYEDNKLVGIVVAIKIWNSVFPFSLATYRQIIVGGPLVQNNNPEILLALIDELINQTERYIIFTEIQNLRFGLSLKPFYEEAGFYYDSFLTVFLDLNRSSERLWDSLSPVRKNNIVKLSETDYTIKNLSETDEIIDVWNNFRWSIAKQGRIAPEKSFFTSIHTSSTLKPHLRIKGLIIENKLKATILVLTLKKQAHIWLESKNLDQNDEWMYDGFLWGVIQELHSEGFMLVDMGPSGRPGQDFFTRQYKKSYGGMIKETGRYIFIHNWLLWNMGMRIYRWYKKARKFLFRRYFIV